MRKLLPFMFAILGTACTIEGVNPNLSPDAGTGGGAGAGMGSSSAGTGNVSGARLKQQHLAGDDGARQFVGWFDSERQESCSFRIAADGVTRCLPVAAPPDPIIQWPPPDPGRFIVFADPQCMTPIAVRKDGPCPLADYLTLSPSTSCAIGPVMYHIGNPLTLTEVYAGNPCTSYPASGAELYELTEAPPADFVAATLVEDH